MVVNLMAYKQEQFDQIAAKILADPDSYLKFDTVSDFYKAPWLEQFPQGTNWSATGLDDGAEQFYAVIEYEQHILSISRTDTISVNLLSPIRDAKMK
ncbi:MAG TPA: hypothetical protein PLR79_06795 [Acinetobacter sp.]|jgi:hypothetical protein|nr:hypothetical protein [Acinetobacter sp.]HQW54249.1 hypothetical protein [Acinetobacter sp.]HQZ59105.1 hypothetical protein [Acinetobacter sp.]HRA91860.1 hypothetical protein [Acinetobacter sp.]